MYRQKGLEGNPELVLDPNKLSEDGTSRLMQFVVSKNGRYAAYAVSKGGSDWQEIFVMDMATKAKMSDKIEFLFAERRYHTFALIRTLMHTNYTVPFGDEHDLI